MEFIPTRIPDVILIKPHVFGDERGFFLETWQQEKFAKAGIDVRFVQDNHSQSSKNVLRGLHYQIKQPQGKLVRVTSGSVLDVAVDIRRSSPTFGQWVAVELSAENHHMLWVPPGFAHGYLTLSERADFLYKCTDFWAPEHERTIVWHDATLQVDWRLPACTVPVISEKDAAASTFESAELFSD